MPAFAIKVFQFVWSEMSGDFISNALGKRKKIPQHTAFVFISFNRLQIQVWYDTLIFLQFNLSLTQYWLLFKSSVVITSWSSQLRTNDKIILLSREIQVI